MGRAPLAPCSLQSAFHSWPIFDDLPLVHTKHPVLEGLVGVEPVPPALFPGSLLQSLPFLSQHRFVIDLMHIAWRKIHQGLMKAAMVVVIDIPPNLLTGRGLNLLLFDAPVKPFRDGIVRGAANAGK